jgi:hypothetical protein
MKIQRFKLNPMRAAMVGATLLAANNVALAAPVSATLNMVCPFPLIGDQNIIAKITADYPEKVVLADNPVLGPIHIDSITTVPDKARQGLAFVDATTITGSARSINTFHTAAGSIPNNTDLLIEPTTIPTGESGPFDVPATGTAPAVTFDASHVGTVSLTVDDLVLTMKNLKANGTVAPAPVGEFVSDCTVVAGQNTTLVTFEVVGEDVVVDDPADIDVDVAALDFGSLQLGQSATKTVTVRNAGDLALGVNAISVTGAGASAFVETNNCTTLAADAACTVDVTYTASEEGSQSATLLIESTDEDEGVVSVSLAGAGQVELKPEIELSTNAVDFGLITAGKTKSETIVITNTGGASLDITGVALSGGQFSQTNNCTTVAPGASCAVNVTYVAVVGASNGVVTISSDDEDEQTKTVSLSGTGEEETTGGLLLEIPLSVNGSTHITANGGTLPLQGDIASIIDLSTGLFTGDMHLNPTQGSFEIIEGWKRYQATAQVEFEPVGITEGSLIDGKLTAVSTAYVKVPKVTKTLFGLINWKIGGGDNCRTKTPVTFTVTSADGEYFDALSGGKVVGTYDLPKLENCGLLTEILSLKLAGKGNTIDLTMTPILD